MAVSIIDKFTTLKKVQRKNYQLLGITALYMSSKFNEIYPPKLKSFVYVSDNAFKLKDVIKAEQEIMKCFNYKIILSTHLDFIDLL